jgi:hypothetical protein
MSRLAIAAVLLGPAPEPPADALGLEWHAPERCPQREAIAARVHALLPGLGDRWPPVQVHGRIDLASEGWTVNLRFESERGVDERRFSGPDCATLGDAAALVIAVSLDPVDVALTLAADEVDSAWARAPEPEPKLEPEPLADPPPNDEPQSPPPLHVTVRDAPPPNSDPAPIDARFLLAAVSGGGYGPLRLAHAAAGIELGAFGPWWRATVRGLWLPPRIQGLGHGNAGRFDGFALAARGCAVPWRRRVEFPICAGLEAGALRGRGVGSTPAPREGALPWVAVVLGPSLRWGLRERLAIGLDLELLASVVRGGFTIDEALVQSITPAGVRALATVELRLPRA